MSAQRRVVGANLSLLLCLSLLNVSAAVHFEPEERHLLRALFLRRFGLADLVEQSTKSLDRSEMPDYIWQLYDEAQDRDQDIVRHYFPAADGDGGALVFGLAAQGRRADAELVERAQLRVQLPATPPRGTLQVLDAGGRLLAWRRLPQIFSRARWADLDVTAAFRQPVDTVTFRLEFAGDGKIPVAWEGPAALVTFVRERDSRRVRRKRKSGDEPRRHHRKHRKHHVLGPRDGGQCRRTKLYVDFAELNWHDWIMAPAGYEAYQCQGRCTHPMPSQLNTTNHAIIQSLIHSIDPSAVPAPSCVPTETASISILYRDINNTVVVKTYADMKVEACGCH